MILNTVSFSVGSAVVITQPSCGNHTVNYMWRRDVRNIETEMAIACFNETHVRDKTLLQTA